ncbi:MAG: hypothetical protein RIE86_09070 [Imperialibacter sp.]|uniref:hypothetical protein n=1 Tax=Imperialibacter sp. TaxID=2038411 RepID=UPI0032ECAE47
MNKIDTTNKDKGYQRSADELTFIMDELFMASRAFMNMLFEIADPDDIIIMSGCVVDASGAPDYTMTAGYAYTNGEVFELEAAAFTAGGGETAVFVLDSTDVDLVFQDSNAYKAREVRKLKLESGVSGTGLKDYDEVVRIKDIFTLASGGIAFKKSVAVTGAITASTNITASDQLIGNHVFTQKGTTANLAPGANETIMTITQGDTWLFTGTNSTGNYNWNHVCLVQRRQGQDGLIITSLVAASQIVFQETGSAGGLRVVNSSAFDAVLKWSGLKLLKI